MSNSTSGALDRNNPPHDCTGVISLGNDFRIAAQSGREQMLEIPFSTTEGLFEDIVKGPASDAIRALVHKSAILGPWCGPSSCRSPEDPATGNHGDTSSTPPGSGGWVIVLDDVTELLRIEKMAAWQEVARRLAHEIKNP